MPKINSDYIKNNVSCSHCQSNKLKRSYKKSFKSPIDELGNKQKTVMEWRQFTCSSCSGITNVLNTENNIISITKFAALPFCAFDVELKIENAELYAFFTYKDINGDVVEDDLSDHHILNLQLYFNKFDMYVENNMENTFQIYFNKDKQSFISNSSMLNYVNKVLSEAGSDVSIGEEDSFIPDVYLNDEQFNKMVSEYKAPTPSYRYQCSGSLHQSQESTLEYLRSLPMFRDAIFSFGDEEQPDSKNESQNSVLKCECPQCKSINLVCKDQKEFKNTIDENGLPYKGTIQFKEMFCSDCKEYFHILTKNDNVISCEYDPVIPLSGYRFFIMFDEDMDCLTLTMFLKDSYNQAREDDIRTENVLGLEKYLKNMNIDMGNEMENLWSLNCNLEEIGFKSNKELIKFLTTKMKELGATFDKTLNPYFEE